MTSGKPWHMEIFDFLLFIPEDLEKTNPSDDYLNPKELIMLAEECLGVDPSDLNIHMLAWLLNCREPLSITRSEWDKLYTEFNITDKKQLLEFIQHGFVVISAYSGLKKRNNLWREFKISLSYIKFETIANSPIDNTYIKNHFDKSGPLFPSNHSANICFQQSFTLFYSFYKFCYFWCRDSAVCRGLPLVRALDLWTMLSPFWDFPFLSDWNKFFSVYYMPKRETVSLDLWNQLFVFATTEKSCDFPSSNYIWPTAIDAFIDWMKTKINTLS